MDIYYQSKRPKLDVSIDNRIQLSSSLEKNKLYFGENKYISYTVKLSEVCRTETNRIKYEFVTSNRTRTFTKSSVRFAMTKSNELD